MPKFQSLSDLLLQAIETTIDGYLRLEDFTYNSHYYAKGYERPLKKSGLSQAVKRLRTKGYIDTKKESGRLILQITEKGQQAVLLKQLLLSEQWDGKWRVVIFDIPEEFKKVRDVLRSRLKIWGFTQLQKSVWITKKSITIQLRDFIHQAGVSQWVIVFEADKIIE